MFKLLNVVDSFMFHGGDGGRH